MGDLGISDLHSNCRRPCSDIADPVVPAHQGEGSAVTLKLVHGVVQVVDNDGAGFGSHFGNLPYSLFIR
jgi:hypothetical protein